MATSSSVVVRGVRFGLRPRRELGLWLFFGTITMLFAAFTSAYIVRSAGSDWQPVVLPRMLLVSTAILLASSATVVLARRAELRQARGRLLAWLGTSIALGIAFLVAQIAAWQQLVAAGVFVASNAHASFFYMLSGVHGAHAAGGILALLYAFLRRLGKRPIGGPELAGAGAYWHFVDVLWLYTFLLLSTTMR